MSDTRLALFTIGQGKLIPVVHTGPASYTAGGELIGTANNQTGITLQGLGELDAVLPMGLSVSGNYEVKAQPVSNKTANLLWYTVAANSGVTGVTSSGGTGMTAGTYALAFSGGGGSGAAGTITVTTSAVTAITITNPGTGYTTAPSVSAATGGTPPTLTATIGPVPAEQVVAGTDLSGETVRLVYVGH